MGWCRGRCSSNSRRDVFLMIGCSELHNARINGFAPEQVWIHVLDNKPDYWLKQDAQDAIANGFHVSLLILPNESISSLDLIGIKGLTVQLMGKNERRCHEIIKVCQRYAERVIHCLDGHLTILRGNNEDHA